MKELVPSMPDSAACRVMTKADLELVLQWRNHPEIRRYMYTTHEITPEEHALWYSKASVDPKKHLLIYESNNEPLGFVNIAQVNDGGVAEWGFYVSPDAGEGTGRGLGDAALNYAFSTLRLHKLCGQALATNERSIRFHERLGFQHEGRLRNQHFDGRTYIDVICFGLMSAEYQDRAQRTTYE
ncbi:UDP-4-amino-4,6-dideoxy-N-acetyl-beta-L-altrosamine N-acetyltransferase [Pseudohongiella nitratireducens]|uniref:UDP-4-amino-4, 6-dideoxy-N-acetyl-beta-L-altrosamine N-acetyltransferase n=1 Tax=Pseudohongiella nitratireducens TaxID=1768907 RepID=UPI0030EE9C8C